MERSPLGARPAGRRRDLRLALLLFVLAMLLGLDIGAAQIRDALFNPADAGARVERAYRIPSDAYHHDLKPNLTDQPAMWGSERYLITTNSLGFKDRTARKVALQSKHPRVLFIGDSFTEGVGLPFEDTMVGIVAEQLEHDGVEVLNAAVASYSPSIHYAKVRYLLDSVGLHFDELVVFIDIADIHDDGVFYVTDAQGRVQSTAALEQTRAQIHRGEGGLKGFIRDETILINMSLLAVRSIFVDVSRKGRTGWTTGVWTFDEASFDEVGRRGLPHMKDSMDKLAALLKERGISMTIAVYPWPDQIDRGDLDSIHVKIWRDWAAAHDVRLLNFFPDFVGHDVAETLDAYFLERDVHWSAEGHRYMARKLLERYRPEGRPKAAE